jgi:serine/threonine-protein phosphatase 4 regulatory subunit 1
MFSFIACQQALLLADTDGECCILPHDDFWRHITRLSDDSVIGVRIGVARFVNLLSGEWSSD